MIPETLDEWTEEAIFNLLSAQVFELELFDWKEMLPDSKDDKGKARLSRECAAFANSLGGFLVFGIKDDRKLAPRERIVGIDPKIDFPERFGNFLSKSEPRVLAAHRTSPIALGSGNLIHVVYIPGSRLGPHGILTDESWSFPIRTSKGIENMSYHELRTTFSNEYEKRAKLRFLINELESLREEALASQLDRNQWRYKQAQVCFDLQLIEDLLAETFLIFAEVEVAIKGISDIRKAARKAVSVHAATKFAFEGGMVTSMEREGANQQMQDCINIIITKIPEVVDALTQLI